MDFPLILSAINSANAAFNMVKGFASVSTEYAVKEKTIELQSQLGTLLSQLVEIQLSMSNLAHENADIRNKIAAFVDWDRNVVPKYQLVNLAKGVFAYRLRNLPGDGEDEPEPEHHLCYGCFQNRRKAILQFSGYNNVGAILMCNECGKPIINHADKPPSWGPVSVSRRDPFPGY